jgi:uncharacterized phage protein (TIGR01671 family)
MREIKFRVWDKPFNCFVPFADIDSFTNPTQDVDQYTGLCDKNGREIYEGDIVRTQPIPHELNCPRVCVVTIVPYGGVVLTINGALCVFGVEASTEVIGNVHENQELVAVSPKEAV